MGSLFSSEAEAAFSCYRLWESTGNILGFACSAYLCTQTKLYMYMAVLGASMVGYYAVEVVTFKKRSSIDLTNRESEVSENLNDEVGGSSLEKTIQTLPEEERSFMTSKETLPDIQDEERKALVGSADDIVSLPGVENQLLSNVSNV